ncbi:MAG TPA: hypothetical protein VGX03_07015, partial [Candidatus Binatia bacterium]|nr:hypothetical protein [Candidatus Binatia bacterium]
SHCAGSLRHEERRLTNAVHWTTALLRFWRNPRGCVLAVASDRRALARISCTVDSDATSAE